MIEFVHVDEKEKWDSIVDLFENSDIYYTNGYVKPFMMHGDGIPLLIHYTNGKYEAINVVMKRRINDMANIDLTGIGEIYDLSTPYGYGGFLFDDVVDLRIIEQLNDEYIETCQKERIVSEFVRFHPMIQNHMHAEIIYDVVRLGNTVKVDLTNADIAWSNLTSQNRNKIRKAEKNNVIISHNVSRELLEEFKKLYDDTMTRDQASQYYFFGDEFYDALYNECKDEMEIFFAEYEKQIVSMAIILKRNKQLHYHLSASRYEYRSLAATNLLLWEVAKWGCEEKFETLHLGGGLGSAKDNLYTFKKSFNRGEDCEFYVGKKIFDEKIYSKLIELRKARDLHFDRKSDFFPLYRG